MKREFLPTVFWLTGLSGAGKTTLANRLVLELRDRDDPVVLLDGDVMREVFGEIGHDRNSRLKVSFQYSRLCKMLVEQGVHVVCATISLFHQTQAWNRDNIDNYIEIFVDVPLADLKNRDSKGVYSRAERGELKNIVGVDIQAELPNKADVVIKNLDGVSIEDSVALILKKYIEKLYIKKGEEARCKQHGTIQA